MTNLVTVKLQQITRCSFIHLLPSHLAELAKEGFANALPSELRFYI